MRKNNLWTTDVQGNLVFPLREKQLQDTYSTETVWEKPIFSLIALILCAALDFVVFTQLFSTLLYDKVWIQRFSVLGSMIAFDLGPVYLGILVKKRSQGLRVNPWVIVGYLTAFTVVFAFNTWLRVMVKDILIPSDSVASFSIFSSVNEASEGNPAALPYAVFSSMLPFATSLVSFGISFAASNPLRSKLKLLHTQQIELEDAIGQIEAILTEYWEDPDLKGRLSKEDELMYANMVAMTQEYGFMYADYVRERIKEHLGDAASTNELSKDCRSRLAELFEEKDIEALTAPGKHEFGDAKEVA